MTPMIAMHNVAAVRISSSCRYIRNQYMLGVYRPIYGSMSQSLHVFLGQKTFIVGESVIYFPNMTCASICYSTWRMSALVFLSFDVCVGHTHPGLLSTIRHGSHMSQLSCIATCRLSEDICV